MAFITKDELSQAVRLC